MKSYKKKKKRDKTEVKVEEEDAISQYTNAVSLSYKLSFLEKHSESKVQSIENRNSKTGRRNQMNRFLSKRNWINKKINT